MNWRFLVDFKNKITILLIRPALKAGTGGGCKQAKGGYHVHKQQIDLSARIFHYSFKYNAPWLPAFRCFCAGPGCRQKLDQCRQWRGQFYRSGKWTRAFCLFFTCLIIPSFGKMTLRDQLMISALIYFRDQRNIKGCQA